MPVTDPASTRLVTTLHVPGDGADTPSAGRGNAFKRILRAATTIASATIPVAGPIIGAVANAIDSRRAPLLASFGGESDTLRYLELQREIERETRIFEATSNVMKARHDATMSSIRNIKS